MLQEAGGTSTAGGGEEDTVGGDTKAGEGEPGGLLGDEGLSSGLSSGKKRSFIVKEPTGKPDLPENPKEDQRKQWRMIMEHSRKRQEQVDIVEKERKEASKKSGRKKIMAVVGTGGGNLSDIRKFWQKRESLVKEKKVLTR